MKSSIINELNIYIKKSLRKFPWRKQGVSDYKLLVTEILLKRTSAKKVKSLWREFFSSYPNFSSLLDCNQEELSNCLRPLGLQQQRSVHLKYLAKEIIEKHNGEIPRDYNALLDLPGVGQYVSGSFLMQLKVPLLQLPHDVNIERVITRLAGEIAFKQKAKSYYSHILTDNINNQINILYALLDIAAENCRPMNPNCKLCPLLKFCQFPLKCAKLSFSLDYKPESRMVLVLSKDQWKIVKSRTYSISYNKKNLPRKFSGFIYIKKPIKAFLGKAQCEKTEKLKLISVITFQRRIPLNIIMNSCCNLNLRAPITWIHPKNVFDLVIKRIMDNY